MSWLIGTAAIVPPCRKRRPPPPQNNRRPPADWCMVSDFLEIGWDRCRWPLNPSSLDLDSIWRRRSRAAVCSSTSRSAIRPSSEKNNPARADKPRARLTRPLLLPPPQPLPPPPLVRRSSAVGSGLPIRAGRWAYAGSATSPDRVRTDGIEANLRGTAIAQLALSPGICHKVRTARARRASQSAPARPRAMPTSFASVVRSHEPLRVPLRVRAVTRAGVCGSFGAWRARIFSAGF